MRGQAPKGWLTRFAREFKRRTGICPEKLSATAGHALMGQAQSLYAVGFTASRAAWMAAPMTGERMPGTNPPKRRGALLNPRLTAKAVTKLIRPLGFELAYGGVIGGVGY